jgi:thioredoxin reductase (NADPH)
VAVLGTGPAGLQAAIHAARRKADVVVLGKIVKSSAYQAHIELAAELGVALDPETMEYVSVNRRQETNVAGIYAAGDICGPPWQIAKAVGEGCVAGLEAAAYAKKPAKETS